MSTSITKESISSTHLTTDGMGRGTVRHYTSRDPQGVCVLIDIVAGGTAKHFTLTEAETRVLRALLEAAFT